MTHVQKRLLELLEEFDGLCASFGLKYSLIDHALLASWRGQQLHGCEIDVVMGAGDCRRFVELVESENRVDREVESLLSNPLMPGWYFRYVDASTTLFSLDYAKTRAAHGIAINIFVPKTSYRSFSQFVVDQLEKGLNYSIEPSYRNGHSFRLQARCDAAIVRILRKVCGPRAFSRWVDEASWGLALDSPSAESCVRLPARKKQRLPKGFLADTKRVSVSGTEANASVHAPSYLASRYGKRWKKCAIPCERETYMVFGSVSVPYKKFLEKEESLLCDRAFWKRRRRWLKRYRTKLEPQERMQNKRWSLFFMTEELFSEWKLLAPHKDLLWAWRGEGRHDLPWLLMKRYRLAVAKYAREGIAFIIDVDIWNVLLDLLRERGDVIYVEKLERLAKEHATLEIKGSSARAYLANHESSFRSLGNLGRFFPDALASAKEGAIDDVSCQRLLCLQERFCQLPLRHESVLFAESVTTNAGGDMVSLLESFLRDERYSSWRFSWVASDFDEVEELSRLFPQDIGRIDVVARDALECRIAFETASLVFTSGVLPGFYIKRTGQTVVYCPGKEMLWVEEAFHVSDLKSLSVSLNKADGIVTSSEELFDLLASHRARGCSRPLERVSWSYPRYARLESHLGGCRAVISFSSKRFKALCGVNGDSILNWYRVVSGSLGLDASELVVMVPGGISSDLLEKGEDSRRFLHSMNGVSPALAEAEVVITDNRVDLMTSLDAGVFVVMICSPEWHERLAPRLEHEYSDSGYALVGNEADALTCAASVLQQSHDRKDVGTMQSKDVVSCCVDFGRRLFDMDCASGVNDSFESNVRRNLLCLDWDVIHGGLDALVSDMGREWDVLLFSKGQGVFSRKELTFFSHMPVMYTDTRRFSLLGGERQDETATYLPTEDPALDRLKVEWRRVLGPVRYNSIFVPQSDDESWLRAIRSAPGDEIVLYGDLSELLVSSSRFEENEGGCQ